MATMYDPPHLGELIRESIEAKGWTVVETAKRLDMGRVALSRVLNGHAGVSAVLALALERIGWSAGTQNTGCGCKQSTMWLKSDGSRRSCSAHRCRRPADPEGDRRRLTGRRISRRVMSSPRAAERSMWAAAHAVGHVGW